MKHPAPDIAALPAEDSKRFVAVLNKKVEIPQLMNALGHMAAGTASLVGAEDLCFLNYPDKEAGEHFGASHFPFIVLKAENSNQIRTVRAEAMRRGIPFNEFTRGMVLGTEGALDAMRESSEADLDYFGICLFGGTEELREFTGKFSLFR
ncbi:MAG: DUF2000 domain-containing protein [Candidatus Gracilibacteria bacterium]|jgi:hypothetical protein